MGALASSGDKRCPRLTKIWLSQPSLGVVRSAEGKSIGVIKKRSSDAFRQEGLYLASRHGAVTDMVGPTNHVALAVDCGSAPYELATFAVCLPQAGGFSAWLTPRDHCAEESGVATV